MLFCFLLTIYKRNKPIDAEYSLCNLDQGDDNATLYGVCLYVSEIVQRPPGILGALPSSVSSGACGRFLASAPRCYCLLTRVPFFELHYDILNRLELFLFNLQFLNKRKILKHDLSVMLGCF